MGDAFRLWCKHFTSRPLVFQKDIHVTSYQKLYSQNTPETGTKKRTLLYTKNIFYIVNFLRRILFIQYILMKPMQSTYDFSV